MKRIYELVLDYTGCSRDGPENLVNVRVKLRHASQ